MIDGVDNDPEASLTRGQRDAIQDISDAFPNGYYMMLCSGKSHKGQPETHIIISKQNFYFLNNRVGQMI
jgi:hypothetical protein